MIYEGLDDLDAITAAAAEHDLVINAALSFHSASGKALIHGLAQRKATTGRDTWIIHTSGTSSLADQPISGKWVDKNAPPEGREFDDAKDAIYEYEKEREAKDPYPQRATDLDVIDTGLDMGVQTLVIMSPTIYGRGTGLFNRTSIQVAVYVRSALDHGRAVVVGKGDGVWDHVNVQDVAARYELAVRQALEKGGEGLPRGKRGIIFCANGRHTWKDVAQGVADACYDEGKIKDKRVEGVERAEGAKLLAMMGVVGNEGLVELGLSSNARTVSTVAKKLGWEPTRGEEAWMQGFGDEVKAVLEERRY